jgi:hypothetical protein
MTHFEKLEELGNNAEVPVELFVRDIHRFRNDPAKLLEIAKTFDSKLELTRAELSQIIREMEASVKE